MSRAQLIDPEKNIRGLYKSIVAVRQSSAKSVFTYKNPNVTIQYNVESFTPTLGISDLTNAELIYIHIVTTIKDVTITSTVGNTSKIIFNPIFPAGWNVGLMCQIVFKPQDNPNIAYSTSIGAMRGSTDDASFATELYFEDSKQLGQRSFNVNTLIWGLGLRISMD